MTWNEEQHPRDAEGQFTHTSIGSWARKAAAQLAGDRGFTPFREAAKRGEHPLGWAAAKARAGELWNIPDRGTGTERTDAEQDELDALEAAFAAYREQLGISHQSGLIYQDGGGLKWSEHGEFFGRVTTDPPVALRLGYRRVGEHPEGTGSVRDPNRYITPSLHPEAGGLWIDPKRPGTRHAPDYRNDMGHGVSSLRPDTHRSVRHKGDRVFGRLEGGYGTADGAIEHETTWRGRRIPGRIGYPMEGRTGTVSEFLGYMKRARARAKVEAPPKTAVRRTPKGTRVEGWTGTVSERMGQRGNGRG